MGDGWFVITEKSDYIQAIGPSSTKFQQFGEIRGKAPGRNMLPTRHTHLGSSSAALRKGWVVVGH